MATLVLTLEKRVYSSFYISRTLRGHWTMRRIFKVEETLQTIAGIA